MSRSSAEWLQDALSEHTGVESLAVIGPHRLRIETKLTTVDVAVFGEATLTDTDIRAEVEAGGVAFVVNVPKTGVAEASARELATKSGAAIGGVGDLMSALSLADPSAYVNREIDYTERRLRQSVAVQSFRLLDDYRYEIISAAGQTVTAVIINEYEPSVDCLREVLDAVGPFDHFVTSNPYTYGFSTPIARVAKETGIGLSLLSDFLDSL